MCWSQAQKYLIACIKSMQPDPATHTRYVRLIQIPTSDHRCACLRPGEHPGAPACDTCSAACAIHQRGNARSARALPIDFVHASENWFAMPITGSKTVKIEMNIFMAIRDFFLGFFFCLNNNNIYFMI